jgi:hypothetical protein
MQAAAIHHNASRHQLLVELAHIGEQLLTGHLPCLRLFARFDDNHDSHSFSPWFLAPEWQEGILAKNAG